jgi:hypothetical protein
MNKPGVATFYYTRELPFKAVAIAHIHAGMTKPADLTDITSTPYLSQALTVTGSVMGTRDAYEINHPISISGSFTYELFNQFFQLTNVWDNLENGKVLPYFHKHQLRVNVTDVMVKDVDGNRITKQVKVVGNVVYHDLDGGLYYISYYENRNLKHELLRYEPVVSKVNQFSGVTSSTYTFSPGGVLEIGSDAQYYLRFTRPNGFYVRPPYNTLANEPWYPRISFSINPLPREWARQQFIPYRPYQIAAWAPGKVLTGNIIEFERRGILFDGLVYPDILIYSKDHKFKHALDGTPVEVRDKGYLFPWMKSQILDIEPWSGRLRVGVDLEQDDIVYGFFNYEEPDILYKDLDINPYTNPRVRDLVVEFYYKNDPANSPFRNIFYRTYKPLTSTVTESTNDPNPDDPAGTRDNEYVFSRLVVGFSVGLEEMVVTDARVRGGGLAPEYQSIPESKDMWDIGYWDGKPCPVKGGMIIYMPESLYESGGGKLSQVEIDNKIKSIIPTGTVPVVFAYNSDGAEV